MLRDIRVFEVGTFEAKSTIKCWNEIVLILADWTDKKHEDRWSEEDDVKHKIDTIERVYYIIGHNSYIYVVICTVCKL